MTTLTIICTLIIVLLIGGACLAGAHDAGAARQLDKDMWVIDHLRETLERERAEFARRLEHDRLILDLMRPEVDEGEPWVADPDAWKRGRG